MPKLRPFPLLNKLFYSLNSKRKVQFFLLIFLNVISSCMEALALTSSYPFLSMLQSKESIGNPNNIVKVIFENLGMPYDFKSIVLFFMVSIIFSSFLKFLVISFNAIFSNILAYEFSLASFSSSLSQESSFFLNNPISKLVNRNIKGIDGTVNVIAAFLQIITSFFLILITSTFLIFINPKLTIAIFLLISIIYTLIFRYFKNFMLRASRIIYENNSHKLKIAQEAYRYFKNIILDKTGYIFFNSFKKNEYQYRRMQALYQIIVQSPKIIIENSILLLIGLLALILIPNNNLDIKFLALLGTYALSLQRLLPIAQAMFLGFSDIKRFSSELEDVLNLPFKNNYDLDFNKINDQFDINEISVKDIKYYHPRSKKYLIENVKFNLKKGDYIGISGKSGSGKSTLLDIFMGFLKPSSGYIKINGVDIYLPDSKDYLLKWQNSISFVSQSPLILNDTIRKNLLINGSKKAKNTDKDLYDILEIVELKDFTKSLPYKIDTILGDDGNAISGGQKQRIAIARALLKRAKILVLDESTTGLDRKTEMKLLKNIVTRFPELIIIFVSHNPDVFKFANLILKLDK